MSFLKKKMGFSGIPPAAEVAPFDGTNAVDDEEASHPPCGKHELSNYYDDDNQDDDILRDKQDASYQDDDEEDEPEHVDYEGLLQQAAEWKATMQSDLDKVYKLRIESAITLDTFAMMYPTNRVDQNDDDEDDDGKNNAATAADSHDNSEMS